MKILVAGATGALGREVVRALRGRGHTVRALGRNPDALARLGADEVAQADVLRPDTLKDAVTGVDGVFSALGAPVMPSFFPRAPFHRFDTPANVNLIEAAEHARVGRFVYISLAHASAMKGLDYADAHEAVVERLRRASLRGAVLRPTGFYSAFLGMAPMARLGVVPVFGNPGVRTNPIDERDLADLASEALEADATAFSEREVGGPEILTRADLIAQIFAALGKKARTARLPVGLVRFNAALLSPLSPRMASIMRFLAWIGTHDCTADAAGQRTFSAYLDEKLKT